MIYFHLKFVNNFVCKAYIFRMTPRNGPWWRQKNCLFEVLFGVEILQLLYRRKHNRSVYYPMVHLSFRIRKP